MTHKEFTTFVFTEGKRLYRDMPWRHAESDGTYSAYKILVSEMMLQQTQVARVIPKYLTFIDAFPTIRALADAPLIDVLLLWNGLGYNRRAKYLHLAAQALAIIPEPWTYNNLTACKGIGPNTAAAVRVYAYNKKETFVETNVRTVLAHYLFVDQEDISDNTFIDMLHQTLDTNEPRVWYWALMDIGSDLKSNGSLHLTSAKAYKKQPTFIGSQRQLRGMILKELAQGPLLLDELCTRTSDKRCETVVHILLSEELITQKRGRIYLGS